MAKTLVLRAGLMVGLSTVLCAQRGPGLPIPSISSINNSTTAGPGGTQLQRPVYVAGNVVLEDGTAPVESIPIQMLCSGTPRSIGFTDLKGRFDIDMNDRKNSAIYSDASLSGPYSSGGATSMGQNTKPEALGGSNAPTTRNYATCDLVAALAGYRSDRLSLSSHRALEDPNVGTIPAGERRRLDH
jgi:hypothetical protein